MITALLGLSLYESFRLARENTQLNAAAQMRDITQSITKDLFNLKLSYGEDVNSPHIRKTLENLATNNKRFTQYLNAFDKGGEVLDVTGNTGTIPPVNTPISRQGIEQAKAAWGPYTKLINTYLLSAKDVAADSTALDLAVDYAQGASVGLYGNMNTLSADLGTVAERDTNILRVIQLSGIVAAILYFIVFMFYFMRKLRESDAVAEEARRETSEIMATVDSGLFLLDKDLNLGSQYSRELENVIGQRNVGGRNFGELLETMVSPEDLETTRGFINQLYNPRVKERLIADLNPLVRTLVKVDDFSGYYNMRYLDFKFSRVYQGTDIVRILVSVSDVTDAVRLEQKLLQEREHNDLQIEMLTTILNADAVLINDFIGNTENHIEVINGTLKAPGNKQQDFQNKLRSIYREVHSLKGEASALNLYAFTTIANSFEDRLSGLQNRTGLVGDDFLPLTVLLEDLINLTNTIKQLSGRITHSNVQAVTQQAAGQTAAPVRQYFEKFVGDLATRNYKQIEFTCHGADDGQLPEHMGTVIREISVQLLRNAVVHGIETPVVRQQANKSAAGHIQLTIARDANEIQLVVEDDGRGVDFEAIRQKAIASGYAAEDVAQWDNKQLLTLMFSSGFSTLNAATDDAGRGVGLDVIKDRVQSLNGKIRVATKPNEHTRFSFIFPLN